MREKIAATLAGLVLFLVGWFCFDKAPLPVMPDKPVIVARPVQGELSSAGSEWTLRRKFWESDKGVVKPRDLLLVLRCKPPEAKFDPRTVDKTPIKLTNLASQESLKRNGKFFRLPAGPYEMLAEAEGHVPQKLSIELSPGELKTLEVALKEIPKPPTPPTRPVYSAPPRRPLYRPRPAPRPRPRPRPRFTPVAKPRPVRPVPLFTPLP